MAKVSVKTIEAFRGQNYDNLKKVSLKTGRLFEDPEFPANSKSLFISKTDDTIQWMRPKEISKVPKLFVEGMTCDDLNPGELSSGWFVTACASLAQDQKIWQKVIPNAKEQDWDEKNVYAGMFKFNFWRYGQWTEVVIDDRLPTKNGKLVYCHAKSRNEFWPALLEKAYAKLFSNYESMGKGHAVDALVDFTGGVAERLLLGRYDLHDGSTAKWLFGKILNSYENGDLIVTMIECSEEDRGKEGDNGLVLGQGYTITAANLIDMEKVLQGDMGESSLKLMRLYNPCKTKEWTGAWCDGSQEWKLLPQGDWERLGVNFKQEGEFWMSFKDFTEHFTHLDICHAVSSTFQSAKKWHETFWHNQWHPAGRNGGGNYESATVLANPQYSFDVQHPEEKVMVSLEQHDVEGHRRASIIKIGFHLVKVEDNRRFRMHVHGEKVFTSRFDELRSVFGTTVLKGGRYVIIPATKDSGICAKFMLRLYAPSNPAAKELAKDEPSVLCPCLGSYRAVTTIKVEKCEGLQLPAGSADTMDPFVIIKCEGEKVQSQVLTDTLTPEFNTSAIFYRKKPEIPIFIEVWNHNRMMNDFLGEAHCETKGSEAGVCKELSLYGTGQERATTKPGTMHVCVKTSNDLTHL